MQQRITTGKSSLYSTKFHIVLQNTSNTKSNTREITGNISFEFCKRRQNN